MNDGSVFSNPLSAAEAEFAAIAPAQATYAETAEAIYTYTLHRQFILPPIRTHTSLQCHHT